MKIIAVKQIYGDYGSLHAGEVGYIHDHLARELIKRGLIRQAVDAVSEPVAPTTPALVPTPKRPK